MNAVTQTVSNFPHKYVDDFIETVRQAPFYQRVLPQDLINSQNPAVIAARQGFLANPVYRDFSRMSFLLGTLVQVRNAQAGDEQSKLEFLSYCAEKDGKFINSATKEQLAHDVKQWVMAKANISEDIYQRLERVNTQSIQQLVPEAINQISKKSTDPDKPWVTVLVGDNSTKTYYDAQADRWMSIVEIHNLKCVISNVEVEEAGETMRTTVTTTIPCRLKLHYTENPHKTVTGINYGGQEISRQGTFELNDIEIGTDSQRSRELIVKALKNTLTPEELTQNAMAMATPVGWQAFHQQADDIERELNDMTQRITAKLTSQTIALNDTKQKNILQAVLGEKVIDDNNTQIMAGLDLDAVLKISALGDTSITQDEVDNIPKLKRYIQQLKQQENTGLPVSQDQLQTMHQCFDALKRRADPYVKPHSLTRRLSRRLSTTMHSIEPVMYDPAAVVKKMPHHSHLTANDIAKSQADGFAEMVAAGFERGSLVVDLHRGVHFGKTAPDGALTFFELPELITTEALMQLTDEQKLQKVQAETGWSKALMQRVDNIYSQQPAYILGTALNLSNKHFTGTESIMFTPLKDTLKQKYWYDSAHDKIMLDVEINQLVATDSSSGKKVLIPIKATLRFVEDRNKEVLDHRSRKPASGVLKAVQTGSLVFQDMYLGGPKQVHDLVKKSLMQTLTADEIKQLCSMSEIVQAKEFTALVTELEAFNEALHAKRDALAKSHRAQDHVQLRILNDVLAGQFSDTPNFESANDNNEIAQPCFNDLMQKVHKLQEKSNNKQLPTFAEVEDIKHEFEQIAQRTERYLDVNSASTTQVDTRAAVSAANNEQQLAAPKLTRSVSQWLMDGLIAIFQRFTAIFTHQPDYSHKSVVGIFRDIERYAEQYAPQTPATTPGYAHH
ncbi:MAG: hypothetical protein Tsb005_13090 [Gammaproteobacteria bacterium]